MFISINDSCNIFFNCTTDQLLAANIAKVLGKTKFRLTAAFNFFFYINAAASQRSRKNFKRQKTLYSQKWTKFHFHSFKEFDKRNNIYLGKNTLRSSSHGENKIGVSHVSSNCFQYLLNVFQSVLFNFLFLIAFIVTWPIK